MTTATKFLCRLCLEEANHLLEVFSQIGEELKICEVVAQHFWFQIRQDDTVSNKVCTVCWSKIEDFHIFYTKVQKAQDSFTVSNDNNLPIINNKCEFKNIIEKSVCGGELEGHVNFCHFKIETQIDNFCENHTLDIEVTSQKHSLDEHEGNEKLFTESNEERLTINCQEKIIIMPDNEIIENNELLIKTNETSICDIQPRSLLRTRTLLTEKDEEKYSGCLDSSSGSEESKHSVKKKKRGRKPIKREQFEAEKETEEKIIESYYRMKCDVCHSNMEGFETLFDHYGSVHNIRGFILCCGKKIFRRPVIAEHVLWHTNPDMFKCKICDKIYADKRCLNNHLLAHAPPDMKLFKCQHCPKSFVKKFKLDQHKLSHLSPEEKKYICEECKRPYASDALLRAHKRVVHEKTYAHMCEICAKVFKSRVFFEKHQLEHLGQNLPRVQCAICKAWMKNEHTMRAHLRLHQDAGRVHECEVCGRQGPSRNAILKHKRFVHLSDRKFKCTLCDKAFKRAITLKEHMAVHTGEVLYNCTFCPKTFNSGANMHAHRKKAHPVEWEQEKRNKILVVKSEIIS